MRSAFWVESAFAQDAECRRRRCCIFARFALLFTAPVFFFWRGWGCSRSRRRLPLLLHVQEALCVETVVQSRFPLRPFSFLFRDGKNNFEKIKNMNIELLKGDCLTESDKIKDASVDLILTDLPYGNMDTDGGRKLGIKNWDKTISPKDVFEVSNRILRKNGKMVLFSQEPYTTELIKSPQNVSPMFHIGFSLLNAN